MSKIMINCFLATTNNIPLYKSKVIFHYGLLVTKTYCGKNLGGRFANNLKWSGDLNVGKTTAGDRNCRKAMIYYSDRNFFYNKSQVESDV